jgi:glycosyltransferase involved in cell wall biosynthesis
MTPRTVLVATTTATDPGELVAARARHLLDLGWDAHVLCRDPRWADVPTLRALGDRFEVVPAGDGRRGPIDRGLRRLRPDLVHFHSGWAASKCLRTVRRLGCGMVVSLRDDGRDLAVPRPRRLTDAADVLIFPSAAVRDRAAERGWDTGRAEVIATPLAAGTHPERAPSGDGPLRLLSFGPLVWEHGLEHAVHAVALARDRGVDCAYRIVGAGDDLQAVGFARHQLGLHREVEVVAPDEASSLADELREADVLLHPVVADGLPGTALDVAHALGVPVISTPRGGLAAAAAIAVGRRDPAAIATAVARLAADEPLRRRMGEAGRRHAEGDRLLADHLERLEHLYRRVLGQPAAASVTSAATASSVHSSARSPTRPRNSG